LLKFLLLVECLILTSVLIFNARLRRVMQTSANKQSLSHL